RGCLFNFASCLFILGPTCQLRPNRKFQRSWKTKASQTIQGCDKQFFDSPPQGFIANPGLEWANAFSVKLLNENGPGIFSRATGLRIKTRGVHRNATGATGLGQTAT